MGAGAIHGHQEPSQQSDLPTSSHAHSNTLSSNESQHQDSCCSSPHPVTGIAPIEQSNRNTMKMSCETCSTNFTLFKRKKSCQECHRYFCSTCLPKPPSSSPSGRQCRKCLMLISGHFTREDLQNWKVKDIRCFLDVRKVSTKGCREKHDLVELVLAQFCKERRNSLAHQAEHDLMVQEMAARLTLDNEENNQTLSSTTFQGHGEASGAASNADSGIPSGSSGQPTSSSSTRKTTSESQLGNSGGEQPGMTAFTAMNSQELRDLLQSQVQDILDAGMAQPEPEKEKEETDPQHKHSSRCKLEEIHSIEDIHLLSIRQLKELLVNNFVNYKGCCEKPELIQKVKRLWTDHQENQKKAEIIHRADEEPATPCTSQDTEEEQSTTVPNPTESTTATENTTSTSATSPPSPSLLGAATTTTISTTTNVPSATPSPSDSPSKRVGTLTTEEPTDSLCRICMDSLTNCILLECGHMVTCTTCGKQLAECPICRQYISRVVRVFRS